MTFHAMVLGTQVEDETGFNHDSGKQDDHVFVVLEVDPPALNGFLPKP